MITIPEKLRILVVDDEPDMHAVTRLALKGLKWQGKGVELATAMSGADAAKDLEANPYTAVMLLDVVMESESAGLETCKLVREQLGNKFVRILLRTGQPGVAPERKTIEDYDIDGYLPKTELSSNRLFAAVRTALKAFAELMELERGRQTLSFLHASVVNLHSFEPLDVCLQRFLTTALAITNAPLAVLKLETYEDKGNPTSYFLHISKNMELEEEGKLASELAAKVATDPSAGALRTAGAVADGVLVPIVLHRDLGAGWFWVSGKAFDALTFQALPILAAHASNALYASVAQAMLASREGPAFDAVTV